MNRSSPRAHSDPHLLVSVHSKTHRVWLCSLWAVQLLPAPHKTPTHAVSRDVTNSAAPAQQKQRVCFLSLASHFAIVNRPLAEPHCPKAPVLKPNAALSSKAQTEAQNWCLAHRSSLHSILLAAQIRKSLRALCKPMPGITSSSCQSSWAGAKLWALCLQK